MTIDRLARRKKGARINVRLRTLVLPALVLSAIAARRLPLPPTSIPLRVILVANDVRD